MPNYPSIYLELQDIWKNIKSLTNKGIELTGPAGGILHGTYPAPAGLNGTPVAITGSLIVSSSSGVVFKTDASTPTSTFSGSLNVSGNVVSTGNLIAQNSVTITHESKGDTLNIYNPNPIGYDQLILYKSLRGGSHLFSVTGSTVAPNYNDSVKFEVASDNLASYVNLNFGAGKGIQFSGRKGILDDYIVDGTSAGVVTITVTGPLPTSYPINYTKIGRVVHYTGYISGSVAYYVNSINGLPWTPIGLAPCTLISSDATTTVNGYCSGSQMIFPSGQTISKNMWYLTATITT